MKRKFTLWFSMATLVITGCTKPYAPKVTTMPTNYLVVEGLINTGANDSTVITLSRTVPLSSATNAIPEQNAVVAIQDNYNTSYNLTQTSPGVYTSAILSLDNTRQYRLNIITSDGKNYLSDYLIPEAAPSIDSIGFIIQNNGVEVYINTHDPKNSTHYYRWDYDETWQFHAEYNSDWITNDSTDMVIRTPAQDIYYCWANDISNNILLGSSAKLTRDVIYQNPITFIQSTSEKIESRYSILIKQYALTSDGYNYYTQLKQNTEQLGGIFDPQPTSLTGNIHCKTNPAIPAIGYVTAGTVQQKRIYIDNTQLPHGFIVAYPFNCSLDTAYYNDPKKHIDEVLGELVFSPSNIVTEAIYAPGPPGPPIGYLFTDRDCADCSVRGSLAAPSFWKYSNN